MHREGLLPSILNATFVRPAKFYLGGFYNIPHVKYYYVFLCFVYIMTVLGNGFLLSVIYLVKTLHTPKYIIVFNLAFIDLCGSTALIPKLLDTFLFNRRYIVYEACLSYLFFVFFFGSLQSWTLVTMAYDRLIAICFPLRYNSIITTTSVVAILLFSWISLLIVFAVYVGLLNRLSFCGSIVIQSFFCDHGPIYRLACNDTSINFIMGLLAFTIIICIPLVLIAMSYVSIYIVLRKTTSREERRRAWKTCIAHLILIALFFLPYLGTNLAVLISNIHPNARIINASLSHTVASLLNPIIYSLKTEEVVNAIRKLSKRKIIKNITTK
ncbi:olfactory receptor 1-like [Fundulus heteroclitus]|uniref:olfactory receptor 1-like n=1 Tax=Fundulus heteroclitus TaxID=8078 RepID=UPI00165B2CBA|nr:olfactory receptor 1-like [Fundulus heteroclitus]